MYIAIKTRHAVLVSFPLIALFISGCASGPRIGNPAGAVVALLVVGTYKLGKTVGKSTADSSAGKKMDANDRQQQRLALENNSANYPSVWINPRSNIRYQVTPFKAYHIHNDVLCRKYETVAFYPKGYKVHKGRACRDSHGRWRELNVNDSQTGKTELEG